MYASAVVGGEGVVVVIIDDIIAFVVVVCSCCFQDKSRTLILMYNDLHINVEKEWLQNKLILCRQYLLADRVNFAVVLVSAHLLLFQNKDNGGWRLISFNPA